MDDKEAIAYRLAEQEEHAQLVKLGNSPNIASVDSEIAIVRNCLHTLIKDNPAGRPSTIKDLANAVGSLVRLRQTLLREQNELVSREALVRFTRETVNIIADALKAHEVGDYESIIDEVANSLSAALSRLENEDQTKGTK